MSDDRWTRVWEVFHEAAERDPSDRQSLLRRRCDGDSQLLAEVTSLLASFETSDFLDLPDRLEERQGDQPEGRRLGAYRVVRRLAEGGMGTVYEAARADDAVDQRVAIKILRRGFGSDHFQELFLRERRILAQLEHPSIARFLDAGTDDAGHPYFVMELVDGTPVDRYCRENELSVDDRLRLFCEVCDAVSYAHRNLVVHRDLKPGNILVTVDGNPKLLDFGIAKLVAGDDGTTRTRVMTPSYASPEQLRGQPVTTSSDVYSLGVVLYELLVGSSPYRADSDTPFELAREILEETPSKPSAAMMATEERGHSRRSRRLRGDLDTIVLTALHKDPRRRYASAEQLAADVRRHLDGLPVSARPDTARYRIAKFVGRHRAAVSLGLLVALALLAAAAITTVQSIRLAEALERAGRERDRAERVAEFLTGAFRAPRPSLTRGRELSAREILDAGTAEIRTELTDEPEIRAVLMDTLGTTYHGLGLYDEAEGLLREALELRRGFLPSTSPDLALSHLHLGTLRYSQARYAEAARAFRTGLGILQGREGDAALEVELADGLGTSLLGTGEYSEAETLLQHARNRSLAEPAVPTETRVKVTTHLAYAQFARGAHDRAEPLLREAVRLGNRELGTDAPLTLSAENTLAEVLYRRGELDEAERLYLEVLAKRERVFGPTHKEVATTLNALGAVQHAIGRFDAAERSYRRSLEISSDLGAGNPYYAFTLNNLAWLLHDRGDYPAAASLYREAFEMNRERLGADHPELAVNLHNLGLVHHELGNLDAARRYHEQAEELTRSRLGDRHPRVAFHRTALASVARDEGDLAGAEARYREALALRRSILPAEHPELATTLTGLGTLLVDRGAPDDLREAERLLVEALEIRREVLAEDHWLTAVTKSALGECLARTGRAEEGRALLVDAYPRIVERRGESDRRSRRARRWLDELEG